MTNNYSPHYRDSNIELLRIVAMFLVVAHHYVVNSGVMPLFVSGEHPINTCFLVVWGAWGKMAINVFVLITGYFMCVKELTAQRFSKIFIEYMFYTILLFWILAFCGYESVSPRRIANVCFDMFNNVDVYFTASFMWFYLGIPFYNRLIMSLTSKSFDLLLLGLLVMFIAPPTFFRNGAVFHHVFWYMTLYFVGAKIRLRPYSWMTNRSNCILLLATSVCLVVVFTLLKTIGVTYSLWRINALFIVSESNRLFAFLVGVFMFLVFKNISVPYTKWINNVAGNMFGVLCIHAASDGMRRFLWQDVCNVTAAYKESLVSLIFHAIVCAIGVMIVCCLFDRIRQRYVERPLFKVLFHK